jgi:mannosylfructose-phosphate synthase
MMVSLHGYVAAEPELGRLDTGGQVVYVLRLAQSLARLGYRVDVYTRRFGRQPAVERVGDRVRIVRIPAGGRDFIPKEQMCEVVPEWVERAHSHITAQGLRYLFINSHYWDAGLAGDSLAARLGVPHVHTPHSIGAWKRANMDGDPDELERTYNFRRRIRDERAVYDRCDLIVATSPQQRDILLDGAYDVPRWKIAIIPPGYDDSRFFPVSAATREAVKGDLGFGGRIILALGRAATNKGYDLLLRAMPVALDRVTEARLLLAVGSSDPTPGERAAVDELRGLAGELGISGRVLFHDYIPDEQLADHYRAAEVFALSSRYEPFGMTAVEAMASGTPTVITTEGGLWEMITWGVDALYADPFDPDAFGHALATVLQYPRVADQLARYGAQKARARFTWSGVAQQLVAVLGSTQQQVPRGLHPEARGPRAPIEPRGIHVGADALEDHPAWSGIAISS